MTKDSIEEGIIESQKRKLALETVVVGQMDKDVSQKYIIFHFFRIIFVLDLNWLF